MLWPKVRRILTFGDFGESSDSGGLPSDDSMIAKASSSDIASAAGGVPSGKLPVSPGAVAQKSISRFSFVCVRDHELSRGTCSRSD